MLTLTFYNFVYNVNIIYTYISLFEIFMYIIHLQLVIYYVLHLSHPEIVLQNVFCWEKNLKNMKKNK